MKRFIALAEQLFQMELETIGNSLDFHWQFNDWNEKFGESSQKFQPELTYTKQDILDLAKLIKADFQLGTWVTKPNDGLYDYLMPESYGGFITQRLEVCLANFTKVGTQTEMFA